jgi:hypothetical protein
MPHRKNDELVCWYLASRSRPALLSHESWRLDLRVEAHLRGKLSPFPRPDRLNRHQSADPTRAFLKVQILHDV